MTDASNASPQATWRDTSHRTLRSDAPTGGGMSIVEATSPAGRGLPRHLHKVEDETFVILTGDARFWLAGEETTRGPERDHVRPARRAAHLPRHLVTLSPGGSEGAFDEMIRLQGRTPEEMDRVVENAARFNLEFTGPPLDP